MEPHSISKEATSILNVLNEGGTCEYFLSSKKVPLFQPIGNANLCPKSLSLIWTKGQENFWHGYSMNIPSIDKDKFLVNAPCRLPGLVWMMNPESATIAAANYIFRELSGEHQFDKIRHLQEKEKPVFDAILSRIFKFAQIMHLSAGTSQIIPWELKLSAYFSAACNLLIEIAQSKELPYRPSPDPSYIMDHLALVLDTCITDYEGMNKESALLLESKEEARKPTFWTNVSLHKRCVFCEEIFGSWDLLKSHKCQSEVGWKCSLCSFEAKSNLEATIHYATLCSRPVSTKCYNCNMDVTAHPCRCTISRQMTWTKIRDFVRSSQLFRIERSDLLQAIMALQSTGRLSFAEEAQEGPWTLSVDNSHMITEQNQESLVDDIIQNLPYIDQDLETVKFPKRPSQSLKMSTILKMASKLDADLQASDSRPSSRSSMVTDISPWDMSSLAMQKPPLSENAKTALISFWSDSSFEDKLGWQRQAVEQDSGYLLAHLYNTGVLKSLVPHLPPFKDTESARIDLEKSLSSQTETLNWINKVRAGSKPCLREGKFNSGEKNTGSFVKFSENLLHKNDNENRESMGGYEKNKETKEGGGAGGQLESSDLEDPEIFECNNENHDDPKPCFSTNLEKMRHVKKSHPCPFAPQCTFFHEYDSAMALHVQRSHPESGHQDKRFACNLCDARYDEQSRLKRHMERDHPTCAVCKQPFANMRELREHQPCLQVRPDIVPKKTDLSNGLLVPIHKAELEGYRVGLPEPSILLAQGLAQLCEQTSMPSSSKEAILKPILQATALIEAQRKNKLYPFQAKAVKWPLIQAPNFVHPPNCRESNKFSEFLGSWEAKDRWNPSYLPSKALPNFYYLKRINDKLSACVAACHLSRETATVLLKQRIHPDIISAMEAKSNTRAQDMRYEELLLLGQSMFFQLSLEKLQHEAESLAREPDEKFHDYFTRCFHLLSTAALGHDEDSRSRYVQFHLRRQLLRALSPSLRLNIENAELELGVEYTASNILDFYMANWQTMEERSGSHKSQLASLPVQRVEKGQRIERNKGKSNQKGRRNNQKGPSVSYVSQDPNLNREDGNNDRKRLPSVSSPPQALKTSLVTEGRAYRDSPPKSQTGTNQPSPRAPFQGMTINGADAFRQVTSANKRAEFAIATKAKLGLPPHDMSRFCFRCGAGNAKSSRSYHSAKECKLPPSDKVHQCLSNIKLLHEERNCPFNKSNNSNKVGGITIGASK